MGKHAGKILTRSQTAFFLFVNQNLVYPHFSFLSPDLLSVSLSICRGYRLFRDGSLNANPMGHEIAM
jgi:hypothetical protein